MNTKKAAIFLIIIILLIFSFIPHSVYAEDPLQDMKDQATSWINNGEELGKNILPSSDLQKTFVPIGQVLVAVATIVVLVVTIIMGIKYITANLTANPEEKGKLKQQLIGLVVSIVVIYGAVGIWNLVQNIMKSLDI